jgi:hypothetical protein
VLEWPKTEQEFGPPLDHRLDAGTVISLAKQAGFQKIKSISLTHLVLYLLDR